VNSAKKGGQQTRSERIRDRPQGGPGGVQGKGERGMCSGSEGGARIGQLQRKAASVRRAAARASSGTISCAGSDNRGGKTARYVTFGLLHSNLLF
jgi:hypothetical protein